VRTPFFLIAILTAPLIIPTLAGAAPITFSGAGADAAAIQGTVDSFRTALGGVDNGNAAGPFATGRREISWDGGGTGAAPLLDMPKDLFKPNRGAFFGPDTTTFSISGQTVANPEFARFGNINSTYPTTFTTFSAPRLFSPTNSIITDQIFFVPGSNQGAATKAFGAIFADVDLASTSSIEYFNPAGASLGKFFAPTANNGLSFLGVQFTADEWISKIRITTGNTILGPNDGGAVDVVVLDNLIYAEPQPVPELASFLLLGAGLAALYWRKRSQNAQQVPS
jgi:hypothetical protein